MRCSIVIFFSCYIILLFAAQVNYGLPGGPGLHQAIEERFDPLISQAFHTSQIVARKSGQPLFYIVAFDSTPAVLPYIQQLHQISIQTFLISNPGKLRSRMFTDRSKNMIFILNDVEELLDLIFYSISKEESSEFGREIVKNPEHNRSGIEHRSARTLPHYCVKIDERFLWSGPTETYCEEIEITSAELEIGSILTDSLFKRTRGLYINNIWNFKNYLLFVLKNDGRMSKAGPRQQSVNSTNKPEKSHGVESGLIFCFKFFWRFFKGQKTIICHTEGCEKYDPFTGDIISTEGNTSETFFDFSWNNMHGRPMRVFNDILSGYAGNASNPPTWTTSSFFYGSIFRQFGLTLNCTMRYELDGKVDYIHSSDFEVEHGLKYGVDLHFFENGMGYGGHDFSKVDYSVSIDTSALCIATPHSSFMSQGLVIFKSVSSCVWIFILITIFLFILTQCFFQYSQCELFSHMYSEAEIDRYRNTSSTLTVYAYFICGCPPTLFLGRLFTGKILFFIFSFSALIISTAFLSGMTTLLSNRVLYPEIDSLKTLEESDLSIQIMEDPLFVKSFLHLQNQSEEFNRKFECTLVFYIAEILANAMSFFYNSPVSKNASSLPGINDGYSIDKAVENIRRMATYDAILVSIPSSSKGKDRLFFTHHIAKEESDYHLMEECLMTHPLMLTFLKNSFFFEKLNEMISKLLETGHARRGFRYTPYMRLEDTSLIKTGTEPRAYSLNDLQSPFVGLVAGLFVSFLAFLAELWIDFHQDSSALKCLKRMRMVRMVLNLRSLVRA